MSRSVRVILVTSSCIGLVLSASIVGGTAIAEPTPSPSNQDLSAAQERVSTTQDSVARLEATLTQLRESLADAQVQVQVAAEANAEAQAELDAAAAAVTTAQQTAQTAQQQADQATQQLGALYRAEAQRAGEPSSLHAITQSQDVGDLVAWDAMRRAAARQTGASRTDLDVTRAQARSAATRADAAAALYREKQQAAQTTLAAARRAATDLTTQEQASSAEREVLLVQLAQARSTTVAIERSRQEAHVAQVTRQQEATAQAAVTAGPNNSGGTRPSLPSPELRPTPQPTAPGSPQPSQPTQTPKPVPPTTSPAEGSGAAKGRAAVAWAMGVLGAPYELGATGPNYDCSGLTMRAWEAAGVSITRTSRSQYQRVAKIPYSDLRPGDLIFYATNRDDPRTIYHVAMYIGNSRMIEAPSPGQVVRTASLRYTNAMPVAGRP